LKRLLLLLIKLGLPLGMLGYLLWSVDRADYITFWQQPKRWDMLCLAQATALLAIVISILRWRQLVLSLEIPFTTREALRLGFLGYLLNFVSLGSVGGDLFKAILVAKQKPAKRPEAIASVLLDRAIGLLGLIILAWLAIFVFAQGSIPVLLVNIGRAAGLVMCASILALLLAVYSGPWFDRLIDWGEQRVPFVGATLGRMARCVRLLRKRPWTIPGLIVGAVAVHSLLTLSVCFVSWGLYSNAPTLQQHFMVVPPGTAVGALPLAPGGLGIQEGAIAGLFRVLPDLPDGYSPLLVATVYRLVTVAIAGIGVAYYLASHGREFRYARLQAQLESADLPSS
jgi:glycosyltransferase 2 family protein